ncbi:DUF4337 domain-containing protein [Microvirga sp. M2]|uniref:DUF4337 domain-containing protein n=1 Tax=Microvirga sp. M2 TaxID=3073270 RepID=UPI0039C3319B
MHAEEAKDRLDEVHERRGTKFIALLIASLAALLAVVETTSDNARVDALKSNTDAANLWSFYQAKTIRQTTLRTEAERLQIDLMSMPPAQAEAAQKQVQAWRTAIERYESEPSTNEGRKELTVRAQAAEAARDHALAAKDRLDLSTTALQIAIVLASASVVLSIGWLAWIGGGLGLIGLTFAVIGWAAPTLGPL